MYEKRFSRKIFVYRSKKRREVRRQRKGSKTFFLDEVEKGKSPKPFKDEDFDARVLIS